jgi:lipopolysaccharide transport system ATP-binding protein
MSDIAIKCQGLSKQYRIGRQDPYKTLREVLSDTVLTPLRYLSASFRNDNSALGTTLSELQTATIWALDSVSFEIRRGEAVGIIGRNGAGKSTLLKLLSRIIKPTKGSAEIHGRVASLLEVGTGFHSELTGRENIYLNGAILGMRNAEITRKFDEIVAFAEVEKFIDMPVKHYSSGMHARLAFAVAAHLEPEILLVDEVLAVGDARFQRKCLNKMDGVAQQGRTVLFVSHNMPAVTRLCPRTILLDEGRVLRDGLSHEVAGAYLGSNLGTAAAREWPESTKAPGNDIVRLCAVRVCGEGGQVSEVVDIRRSVSIEMEFEVLMEGHFLVPNYSFYNEEGLYVFGALEHDTAWQRRPRPRGRYVSTAWVPGNLLSEGTLIIGAAVSTLDPLVVHFYERDVVAFQVVDTIDGNSARGDYGGPMPGVVRPLLRWTSEIVSSTRRASVEIIKGNTSRGP